MDRRPWAGSDRRSRLPANWESQIRPAVLERDGHRCQLRYLGVCVGTATQADHRERGDDHSMDNLQAACGPCHQVKSSREGAAARPRLHRPPEQHPALS